jgi:hypothetical protein
VAGSTVARAAETAENEYVGSSMGVPNSGDVQEEIGDIQSVDETGRKPRLRVTGQAKAEYVTNALLQGNHSSGDVLYLPTLDVGYNIPLGQQFSLDLSAKAESAIYSRYDERGFFGVSGAAFFDWRHSLNAPRLFVGVEPYWYVGFDTGDQLATAVGFSGGTDWGWGFNEGRSLLFTGYKFTSFLADPSADSRNVHRAILGVSHAFTGTLYGQLYYAYQYSDYYDGDRHDSRNIVGSSLAWQIATNWFGIVTATLVDNDSSNVVASYQTFNLGVGFNFQY